MTHRIEEGNPSILVVDDESSVRESLAILLTDNGYSVIKAASADEALSILRERDCDLVLTDLRLDNETGLDIIKYVQQNCPDTESILLTAFGTIESAVEAMQTGAYDYITKPFTNDQLLLKVQKALERKLMREELTRLRQSVAMSYGFDNLVGISKQMTQLKKTARRVAPTDITILITGASGTGKELFARAIHHHSNRRKKRFVAIDCSAIPETLLESELFGHTKGSFTSANQDKKGLLEQADGGTIFLDELSNMPSSVQVKLLRFLEDSEIRAIGSSTSRRVDVRIIAATNKDLAQLVGEDKFREDLYYRLNVIPLNLPALTERAEDIEILTNYFIRKICNEIGRDAMTIDRSATDKLLHHNWPGNVRELENTLKRGIALCSHDQLTADDIMFITSDTSPQENRPMAARKSLHLRGNLMDSSQRSLIIGALNDNDWNYTRTAQELGIGRTTLWRKIKKYDLKREMVSS
ncbi:MAG: sigma-54-dependent Fis family transcriptional regulator [Candidatus Zixiibacteriota bacterium]|nr:MAG: sigma-54-dependent Fis family transcriptional regulator [candidate division Zixibacteria bacterium]